MTASLHARSETCRCPDCSDVTCAEHPACSPGCPACEARLARPVQGSLYPLADRAQADEVARLRAALLRLVEAVQHDCWTDHGAPGGPLLRAALDLADEALGGEQ